MRRSGAAHVTASNAPASSAEGDIEREAAQQHGAVGECDRRCSALGEEIHVDGAPWFQDSAA